MKRILTWVTLLLLFSATALQAMDLSGIWQGQDTARHVLKIHKTAGGFRGELFNLGEEAPHIPRNGNTISSISIEGKTIKFSQDKNSAIFEGQLEDGGKMIAGAWKTVGQAPQPLVWTRATGKAEWVVDPSPHKTHFITVQSGVRLEVLDWGGSGPPLVFVANWDSTAHGFDEFAPKFVARHHVYGITLRGFGLSSAPPPTDENYDSDRLGDDVLAVIDAFKLNKPVVAGSLVAGETLSSIGTRYPEKVAGLIYLDAAQQFAFYEPNANTTDVDIDVVRRDLDQFHRVLSLSEGNAVIDDILATLPRLQAILQQRRVNPPAISTGGKPVQGEQVVLSNPLQDIVGAIGSGFRKYTGIKSPFLAIVAVPLRCQSNCDRPAVKAQAAEKAKLTDAIEADYPADRIVRLPNAYVLPWRSNEADVEREMNAFMDGLPKS